MSKAKYWGSELCTKPKPNPKPNKRTLTLGEFTAVYDRARVYNTGRTTATNQLRGADALYQPYAPVPAAVEATVVWDNAGHPHPDPNPPQQAYNWSAVYANNFIHRGIPVSYASYLQLLCERFVFYHNSAVNANHILHKVGPGQLLSIRVHYQRTLNELKHELQIAIDQRKEALLALALQQDATREDLIDAEEEAAMNDGVDDDDEEDRDTNF